MDMTKREALKSSRSNLAKFSLGSFISLIVGAISLVFALPMGQTFMDLFTINVQFAALILSIVLLSVSSIWIIYLVRHFFLWLTMSPEVQITGETIWGKSAEIRIENGEPVDLLDVYVKLARFCWNKSIWNDVKSLTGVTSNNFFSGGLVEANRTISRSPIFVTIAKSIETPNITRLLLDNNRANMPLNPKNDVSAEQEYEFVFEITGRFRDEDESVLLGKYYGRLYHEQIQVNKLAHRQDNFKWVQFYKTSDAKESKLKKEREKQLGFSLSTIKT
jgi:hypothetical protein